MTTHARSGSHPTGDLATVISSATEAVRLADLVGSALPSLQRAIGASNALLYRYGDDGFIETLGGSLREELPSYSRELLEGDPLQQLPRRLPAGSKVVMVTREVGRGVYSRSDAYQLFYKQRDLEHVTCVWLSGDLLYGEPGMTGMFFARGPREEPFGERELHTLEHALPAMAAAVRRSVRHENAEDRRSALEVLTAAAITRPVIAFHPGGRVLWMSTAAEGLLRPGAKLPGVLADAARRLGAFACRRTDGPTVHAVSFAFPDGSVARAELSVARSPDGDAVVVAELQASPSLDRRLGWLADEHRLTRAEVEVLRILAEGVSNRQIATRLHVSIETVRTHVVRILAKMGVETRTQAALVVADRSAGPTRRA